MIFYFPDKQDVLHQVLFTVEELLHRGKVKGKSLSVLNLFLTEVFSDRLVESYKNM